MASCVHRQELEDIISIGGHLLRYPWSAISDWAWYRNFRYRTEESESDIISDIGINFYPISDIRHPNILMIAQWLRSKAITCENKGLGFEFYGCNIYFLDIGYRNGLRCRYRNSSDIGMTVFSSTYSIFFRYRNNRCRCQMSDIADITIDVDANLWLLAKHLCFEIKFEIRFEIHALTLTLRL